MVNKTFNFNNDIFNNSNEDKVIGITIDNKLTFKSNIKNLCKKSRPENKCFIKSIKLSLQFPEKMNFEFHSTIRV